MSYRATGGQPVILPGVEREQLVDGHGRSIGDVRISVTDRCNFRCQYCMPADGLKWLERSAVLDFEEITRVVGLLASIGVGDVRLPGGEPGFIQPARTMSAIGG